MPEAATVYSKFWVPDETCAEAQRSLEAKRLIYDGSHAQACLEALSAHVMECGPSDSSDAPLWEPCLAAIQGQLPPGGACQNSWECAGDTLCTSSQWTCPGVCVGIRSAAVGESCHGNKVAECLDSSCVDGKCEARVQAGEACPWSGPPCAAGLYCVQASTGPTCKAVGALGEACRWDRECEELLRCLNEKCALAKEIGEGCVNPFDCRPGAYCSAGVCRLLPKEGEDCSEVGMCLNAYCKDSQRCVAGQEVGAPCVCADECRSWLCTGGMCATSECNLP